MLRKTIFLDRDGTIIIDKVYLNDPDLIEYLPNSFEGLKKFVDLGYQLVIVTNQSGVARGIVTLKNLEEIHRRIEDRLKTLGIDVAGFFYAPYSVESNHFSRKPNPGMLLDAAEKHSIDLSQSWMIGDRLTDVEAGRRAGTKTIFLGRIETDPDYGKFAGGDSQVADLLEAANFIEKFQI